MTDPVPCIACGRTNGPAATRCLWCGAIIGTSNLTSVETSQAELDYISGIERLEYPTPVKLIVNEAGLDITETLPGSRRISIPANSLIDARVRNPEEPESEKGGRRSWWSAIVGSRKEQRRLDAEAAENQAHELVIRFREDGDVRSATFQRKGTAGLVMVQVVARSVVSVVNWSVRKPEPSGPGEYQDEK